jgi:DNA-binding XRE family transcriptional regulator
MGRRRRDVESFGPMQASSKLPAEERPIHTTAPGLQAAREAAGMTREQVAALCGYSVRTVEAMENGTSFHWMSISRVASVIPGHDLSQIRAE